MNRRGLRVCTLQMCHMIDTNVITHSPLQTGPLCHLPAQAALGMS